MSSPQPPPLRVTAGVTRTSVHTSGDAAGLRVDRVAYAAGSHTHWHLHTGEQVLYGESGRGWVQFDGRSRAPLLPGTVVHIPADARHWQGAAPDSALTHLAVTAGGDTVWLGEVTDEQYRHGATAGSAGRMQPTPPPIPFGEAALVSCLDVLAQVTPEDLDLATPCAEFTVRELGDHLTRSLVLLSGIAGRELTPDPDVAFTESTGPLGSAAIAAWRERGVAGEVAVGRTITPAPLAADIIALELVVHGWDVARAVGTEFAAPDDLCEHLLTQSARLITDDKRGRAFALAVDVASDAPALQRLIAFTGRTW